MAACTPAQPTRGSKKCHDAGRSLAPCTDFGIIVDVGLRFVRTFVGTMERRHQSPGTATSCSEPKRRKSFGGRTTLRHRHRRCFDGFFVPPTSLSSWRFVPKDRCKGPRLLGPMERWTVRRNTVGWNTRPVVSRLTEIWSLNVSSPQMKFCFGLLRAARRKIWSCWARH